MYGTQRYQWPTCARGMAALIIGECGSLPAVPRGRAASALIVLCLLAGGCGSAKTLTASEFVDRVNEQGVKLALGRRLQTSGDADEVYAIRLPPLPGRPASGPGDGGGAGASGSLYVFDDGGSAEDQLRACRASGGLLCFQASNVVVLLEDGGLVAQRLAVAVRRLRD
jgi:hypothetical protein